MKNEAFSESIEMYLKTVSELADSEDLVPISALAERLGVSTVSATEMVHRLKKQDLLEHLPYKGVSLTVHGGRRACRVIRRHRLWERFLVDYLGLPWEKVHDYACRLEHATDTAVTEALAIFLDNPRTCPHGNPIPSPDGEMPDISDIPLIQMQPGDRGIISRIHPESILLLDYLAGRDIRPDQPVEFEEIAPFNGPLMVKIGEQTHALGQEIAAHIFVNCEDEVRNDEIA
ncbi:MAG: metal-dependent transcriptional regulator [Ardenticatenaceae bacterium]|nr:metal-dependent transcriptional regulator [Ardenticatenaceae bacterium]